MELNLTFLPWHLAVSYVIDLAVGDPRRFPHPIRWIGALVTRMESVFYDPQNSPLQQRIAGFAFWLAVVAATGAAAIALIDVSFFLHPWFGEAVMIWAGYTVLSTRSLHQESAAVAEALRAGNLPLARERLSWIVSRDTSQLEEKEILRALVETVSENFSDGVAAPLFFLALGGPVCAMVYKAVNTMDSMVGYLNERYRYFGWFAARADDVANLIPARLAGGAVVAAAALLRMDHRAAWAAMLRDARKMKSPNAGYPEAAAAGALGVQLGGTNIYFGQPVEKPTLGAPHREITLDVYSDMVRLLYASSMLFFVAALGLRFLLT